MSFKRFLLIFVLAAGLLAGCKAAGNDGAAQITGRDWSLVSMHGKEALAGTKVTLKLENEHAGGSAGCNSYGGQYTLQGTKLSFQDTAQTLMACMDPAGVMDQEAAFTQALTQVTSFQVTSGRLELMNAAGETLLVFE
jgi:heat shock protein HslJ